MFNTWSLQWSSDNVLAYLSAVSTSAMSKKDPTQVDQIDLFSQALFMLDDSDKDDEVCVANL